MACVASAVGHHRLLLLHSQRRLEQQAPPPQLRLTYLVGFQELHKLASDIVSILDRCSRS